MSDQDQDQDQTDNQEDEVNASTPINTNELSLEDLDGVVGGCPSSKEKVFAPREI